MTREMPGNAQVVPPALPAPRGIEVAFNGNFAYL